MIRRLEEMSKEDLVKETHGKRLLLVVHPFFPFRENKNFFDFLNSKRSSKYTIILMDQKEAVNKLEKARLTQKVIFVETRTWSDPTPKMSWRKFIRLLKNTGSKEIIISGRNIEKIPISFVEHKIKFLKNLLKNLHSIYGEEVKKDLKYHVEIKKATGKIGTKTTLGECVGYTAAKIANSGHFKVRTTRHFTK